MAMRFLKLNNGLRMPMLGIGTWRAPDAELEKALDAALEVGYRHIDTAPVYMNEKAIGRVLKKWIDSNKLKREDLYIVTKLPPMGNRASCVEKCLRNSLEDLQLSYVDMYLIHTPFGIPEGSNFDKDDKGNIIVDMKTDHVATWKKMEEMVKLGLTKSIGVSNFNPRQVQRIIDNSTIKPSNLQVELHIYLQQNELVDLCKKNGIIVTAYAPLGSRGISEMIKAAGITREVPDLIDNPEVGRIAKKHNKTPAQVLIRWIIERDIVTIPKSTNPDRLKQNFQVFDFSLDKDDMDNIAKLNAGIRVCDFDFFAGMKEHPEFPW